MKTFIATLLSFLMLLSSVSAFVAVPNAAASGVVCQLHPCQAAELEACAYDLMREFNDNKACGGGGLSKSTNPGPVAWLSRRVWARPKRFQRNHVQKKSTSSQAALFINKHQ